jgi:hypothetical protein
MDGIVRNSFSHVAASRSRALLGELKGTMMDLKKVRRQLEALPPEAQRQVADFIAFLYARSQRSLLPKRLGKSRLAEETFVGL